MEKLLVFDLDNTLAGLGRGILSEDVAALRRLEQEGARIAICSGKPTYYLCGFMRQVGLEAPILVGENGAVIQLGVDLPPRDFHVLPYTAGAKASIALLRERIAAALPELWYQPNLVGLTPFPRDEAEFELIADIIAAAKAAGELQDITVYRHCDSFDIVPDNISKKAGLEALAKLVGIDAPHTAAVGDGVNDFPMFEYAGYAIGIGLSHAHHEKVHACVNTCAEALALLAAWQPKV